MDLSFAITDDDILDTTIRDSETNSIMYTVETPRYAEGALTTTATRRNLVNGSTRFAFGIVWGGASLEDARVVLDHRTLEDVPVRQVLERASGNTTYGSVYIYGVEYKWKSKGTGTKVVLVNEETKETVAQSHSRRRSSWFRKPRDMSLEISLQVLAAVDIVLLTFILAWRERLNEKVMHVDILNTACAPGVSLADIPVKG